MTTTFTDEEKALLDYVDSLLPGDGNLVFDFNDSRQYEAAVMITKKSFDVKRFPGKLKALELLKQEHEKNGAATGSATGPSGWMDMIAIPGLGLTSQQPTNLIASNGVGTAVGGYTSMNLTLMVQDKSTGQIVASGVNHDYAGKLLVVKTDVSPSGSTDTNVKATLFYSYTPANGLSIVSGVVKRNNASGLVSTPAVTAPVRTTSKPLDPKAINIGIGRPWTDQGGSSDFDYAWNEPATNNPIGKVPFVGSVVFPLAIQALVPNTTIMLDVYVANQSAGGVATLNATNLANVYSNFTIDNVNPNKLNWNLPPGVTTSNPGNPITFGNVTWPSNMEAAFYCGITVLLSDGNLAYAAVQSTTGGSDDALDGILEIMPISFIWHCLGGNSLVLMEDGTLKLIANILAGDKVRIDSQGGTAVVEWTNKGAHFGHVYSIKAGNGKEIIASDDHVFITNAGPMMASELKVGDMLQTVEGIVPITAIQDIDNYADTLYNIATRKFQEPTMFDGKVVSFFANGFMVGDMNAQKGLSYLRANSIDWVKRQVPAYFQTDVESFFADRSRK
jgi:hypothetical protein